jgi:YegS/Rv2252/BmrU family lipid kinase
MLDNSFIIINPESNSFKLVKEYLDKYKVKYYVSYEKEHLNEIIKNKINKGIDKFIICGGDGTINVFINSIIKLSDNQKNSIKIGIIPCGRANDLARYMNIPLDIENAIERLKKGKIKGIDLVRINDVYMITGGGIGLPSEIIEDANKFSSNFIGRFLKNILGDSLYLIFTIKKFVFGYKGIEIKSIKKSKLLGIYILNQPFIGRRFNLAPKAVNDDRNFEVKIVNTPPSFISNFITLSKGINGELSDLGWVTEKKSSRIRVSINEPSYFMGDGELLVKSDIFTIEIVPKAINLIC